MEHIGDIDETVFNVWNASMNQRRRMVWLARRCDDVVGVTLIGSELTIYKWYPAT